MNDEKSYLNRGARGNGLDLGRERANARDRARMTIVLARVSRFGEVTIRGSYYNNIAVSRDSGR